MPIEILNIDSYRVSSSDTFFFDNNIWMYLFCPIGNYEQKKQRKYSRLFDELINRKVHIYTSSLIISEFFNSFLRLDYNIERRKPENAGIYNDFKQDYFYSTRANYIKRQADIIIKTIITTCQRAPDDFSSIDINQVLFLAPHMGFNDSYYLELASRKNWKILTDDSDFTKKLSSSQLEALLKKTNVKVISN